MLNDQQWLRQGQRPSKLDCEWVVGGSIAGDKECAGDFSFIISQFYLSFIRVLVAWLAHIAMMGRVGGWALFNAMFVHGVPWYKFQYILIIILIVPHDEL